MHLLPTLTTFWRGLRVNLRLHEQQRSIRTTDPDTLARRYAELTADEFRALNGPQRWLDAKLIPRALQRFAHPGPWRMVDLGCGEGDSAAMLLAAAPHGSSVIGYDLAAPVLERARARRWPYVAGAPAARFVAQSVLAPLRTPDGDLVRTGSIQVAHSAGCVGHHLDAEAAATLVAELTRVLARPGIAILDSGPRLRPRTLTRVAAAHGLQRIAIDRFLPWQVRAALTFVRAG
jgi:SAM-dependent methyltransferase